MPLVSHSQNFEDVILWRALKDIHNGFYVDVGAAWPDTHSVTKVFYDHGWFGINIEPNPEFYSRLCEQRPRDINLQIAVTNNDGENSLNLFLDTGLSTLDAEVAKEHVKNLFNCVSISVTTATLASLLRKFLPKTQEIHFLKIDVEGLEAEVLASNDWSLYRPWIVIVESTLPLSQVESHHFWEPRLLAASYTCAYADGLNRFYVENTHLDLLPIFKYPPNVFDEFVLATQIAAEESQRQAEARAIAAEESQRQAEARTIAAEELQRQAEARAMTLFDELTSMVRSRSWKATKPLRQSVLYAKLLSGKTVFALKQIVRMRPQVLVVRLLRSMKSVIERKPAIRNFFQIILNNFPRIKLRISKALASETRSNICESSAPDINSSLRLTKIQKIVSHVLDGLRDHK